MSLTEPMLRPLDAESLAGDLIERGHPLFGTIWVNRERMSGAVCFFGTRVPLQNLFDYLEGGEPLDEFLDAFPGVSREQAIAVLELARNGLLARLPKPGGFCWITASIGDSSDRSRRIR